MGLWTDVVGTVRGYLRLGLTGVRLKNSSGALAVRDAADSADAAVTTSKVNVSGDSVDINSDAAGSGADWKYTLQRPASGMTAAVTLTLPPNDGTSGQVLQTDGSGVLTWRSVGITLGTSTASTSGTSIDFTSIPSGTKRITINFAGVSGNGTSNMMVQIGDSGGIENTGYESGVTNDSGTRVTGTTGFVIVPAATAGSVFSGRVTLELLNASTHKWVSAGQICETNSGMDGESAGSKALSAELDRVRITTVGGTDTFDAGEINITYE